MRLSFASFPKVIAGISERTDGSMVWWNRLPVDAAIRENRNRYFRKSGIDPGRVVSGGLVHGTRVAVIGVSDAGKYLLNTDALVTNVSNLFLAVTAADCMPVFFFDPTTKSVGIAHAGWRGLVGGILENTLHELHHSYGSRVENVHVITGPHIHACHYEVGDEVADRFSRENVECRDGRLFANLASEAEMRLRASGVSTVSMYPSCTYEDENLYSARRDKTNPLQGMVAYIGLR